jgi:hypothetical protein
MKIHYNPLKYPLNIKKIPYFAYTEYLFGSHDFQNSINQLVSMMEMHYVSHVVGIKFLMQFRRHTSEG